MYCVEQRELLKFALMALKIRHYWLVMHVMLKTKQREVKTWDKADRSASQIIVMGLEPKVMALLVTCASTKELWLKLHTI